MSLQIDFGSRTFMLATSVLLLALLAGCSRAGLASNVTDHEWRYETIWTITDRQNVSPDALRTYAELNASSRDPRTLTYVGLLFAFVQEDWRDRKRGFEILDVACQAGEQRACRTFGRSLLFDRYPYRRDSLALELLDESCRADIYLACQDLAVVYAGSAERFAAELDADAPDPAAVDLIAEYKNIALNYADLACRNRQEPNCVHAAFAVRHHRTEDSALIVEAACADGHAFACNFSAHMLREAAETEQDLIGALRLYAQNCETKFATSCDYLFWIMGRDNFFPETYAEAERAARELCMSGNAALCDRMAHYYNNEQVRAPEFAFQMTEAGCRAGDDSLCKWMAEKFAAGDGVERSVAKASAAFEALCQRGDEFACREVARLQPNFDTLEGAEQRGSGCRKGFLQDCRSLAWQLATGDDVVVDRVRATALFQESCDSGLAISCVDLGSLHHWAKFGFPKDMDRAKHYYEKACELKSEHGCELLLDLY